MQSSWESLPSSKKLHCSFAVIPISTLLLFCRMCKCVSEHGTSVWVLLAHQFSQQVITESVSALSSMHGTAPSLAARECWWLTRILQRDEDLSICSRHQKQSRGMSRPSAPLFKARFRSSPLHSTCSSLILCALSHEFDSSVPSSSPYSSIYGYRNRQSTILNVCSKFMNWCNNVDFGEKRLRQGRALRGRFWRLPHENCDSYLQLPFSMLEYRLRLHFIEELCCRFGRFVVS